MMRAHYIVMYDITDAKRLQKVHKICKGYGQSMQYSIFHCELSKEDLEILKMKLKKHVKEEDQILFIKLKPAIKENDPFRGRIEHLGRKFEVVQDKVMIV